MANAKVSREAKSKVDKRRQVGGLSFAASRTTTPGNGCEVSRGKVSLMQCHRTSDRCFASSEHLEDRRVKKYGDRRMESRLYSTIERKEKTIG